MAVTLVLIGAIIWAQIVAESTLSETSKKIDDLSKSILAAENIATNEILESVSDLDKFWEQKERMLSLVMNHNDLNRIGEQIKKVVVYVQQNDKKNCEYELITLQFYMQSYQSVIDIRPEHIL